MIRFGKARLFRSKINFIHKLQWLLFGVADPGHYLRNLYFRALVKNIPYRPKKIFDAGCGSGDYSFYLAEKFPYAEVVACDIDEDSIKKNMEIQRKMRIPNIKFCVSDITKFSETNKFDLIVCIDVLEHIKDQAKVIRNFRNALVPGGYLYLHMPAKRYRPVPFSRLLKSFHEWAEKEHIGKMFDKKGLEDLLITHGFEVQISRYTFSYYAGELAVSLFNLFFENTKFNLLMQGILFPFCRVMCYADSILSRKIGFGLAILAKKPTQYNVS